MGAIKGVAKTHNHNIKRKGNPEDLTPDLAKEIFLGVGKYSNVTAAYTIEDIAFMYGCRIETVRVMLRKAGVR